MCTPLAVALMLLYAAPEPPLPVLAYESARVAEQLPAWLPPARWRSSTPPAPATPVIVPSNTCPIPGTEPTASGRCVPDCRLGACKRIRVAEEQTRFRDAQGRTTGTATPDGSGGFTFRDAQGRTTGRSGSDSSGATRYWDSSGRSLGTSTGPASARPPFPVQR
jgi:hypothetical protein